MKASTWQTADHHAMPQHLKDDQPLQEAINWPQTNTLPKTEAAIDIAEEKLKTIGHWADD